jgi:hypothetical protein
MRSADLSEAEKLVPATIAPDGASTKGDYYDEK